MNRREFVRLAGGLSAGALAETLVSAQVAKTLRRRERANGLEGEDEGRHAARRLGRRSCARWPPSASTTSAAACRRAKMDEAWSVDGAVEAARARRVVRHHARHGAAAAELGGDLDAPRCRRSMLGKSPERDRKIDDICQMIRNCARAGISQVKYNLTFIGIPRTGHGAGPRRVALQHVRLRQGAKQDPPLTIAGTVDADTYWERITYFLERVVPVADGIQGARWAAIRRIPACRRARAGAASRPCSASSTG